MSSYWRFITSLAVLTFAGCGGSAPPASTAPTTATAPTKTSEIIMPSSSKWTSEVHQDSQKANPSSTLETEQPVLVATLSGPSNGFADVAFLGNDRKLALPVRRTSTVKIWDVTSAGQTGIIEGAAGSMVMSMAVTSDSSILALGMNNKTIEIWDLVDLKQKGVLSGHKSNVIQELAFSPDGTMLASCSQDKLIKIWDMKQLTEKLTLDGDAGIVGLAFNHDGTNLVSADFHGEVVVWDLKDGMERTRFTVECENLYSFAILGQAPRIAVGDSKGRLMVINTETTKVESSIQAHDGIAFCVAANADASLVATGGKDQLVKLWSGSNWHELASVKGHGESVTTVRMTVDGQHLASLGGGGTNYVKLWNIAAPTR